MTAAITLVGGWIVWVVWQDMSQSQEELKSVQRETVVETSEQPKQGTAVSSSKNTEQLSETVDDSESFPPPTVQTVNGRDERTIHMGVRQYAWDPSTITVKKGELVRLIVHNADVQHGLVIPALNVLNIDIPPEGAVIEFTPDKVGVFEFFCSYYCGDGHGIMRGKIVVEENN